MSFFRLMNFLALIIIGYVTSAGATDFILDARAKPLQPWSNFNNNVIFRPSSDFAMWKSIYARTVQLPDKSILVTWENWPPEPPTVSWPVFKSLDGGATWKNYSQVEDIANGPSWGNRWQPNMLVLSETFGSYPAGTVLMAGMSVPPDYSQGRMELYASTDGGLTWQYVSRIAEGGRMTTKNGDKAIWEPFLLVHGDQLICYYSDQRDPLHGQKLVHTTTRNLRDWTPVTDDVVFPKYTARPGMAVVAHIRETGKYIMTFEYVGSPTGGSPVWCKIADDPLSFASATAYPIKSSDGKIPDSSPYIIWVDGSSMSRSSGMLIMNSASHDQIWINDASANPSNWTLLPSGQKRAHTRRLEVVINPKGGRKLMITGGGLMKKNVDNYVSTGVIDIPGV